MGVRIEGQTMHRGWDHIVWIVGLVILWRRLVLSSLQIKLALQCRHAFGCMLAMQACLWLYARNAEHKKCLNCWPNHLLFDNSSNCGSLVSRYSLSDLDVHQYVDAAHLLMRVALSSGIGYSSSFWSRQSNSSSLLLLLLQIWKQVQESCC